MCAKCKHNGFLIKRKRDLGSKHAPHGNIARKSSLMGVSLLSPPVSVVMSETKAEAREKKKEAVSMLAKSIMDHQ